LRGSNGWCIGSTIGSKPSDAICGSASLSDHLSITMSRHSKVSRVCASGQGPGRQCRIPPLLGEPTGEGFSIDEAKVEADARLDGLFVLRTNTRLTALQVVLRYRNLLALEQGFLAAKRRVATRPIFHRTHAAIRGHIFCTFLALVLRKELMDRLAARHLTMPEWHPVVDDLANSIKSRSSRTDGARCCAPLLDRRLTHFVGPSGSPCRQCFRNSRALQQPPDASKPGVPKPKRGVYCLVSELHSQPRWESWVKDGWRRRSGAIWRALRNIGVCCYRHRTAAGRRDSERLGRR
jgi:hypothetical protein